MEPDSRILLNFRLAADPEVNEALLAGLSLTFNLFDLFTVSTREKEQHFELQ